MEMEAKSVIQYEIKYHGRLGSDSFYGKDSATLPQGTIVHPELMINLSEQIKNKYGYDLVQITALNEL